MLEATQVEVNTDLRRGSHNSFMASSTCLFANNGGWWALELASVWGGGDGRGQEAEQKAPALDMCMPAGD